MNKSKVSILNKLVWAELSLNQKINARIGMNTYPNYNIKTGKESVRKTDMPLLGQSSGRLYTHFFYIETELTLDYTNDPEIIADAIEADYASTVKFYLRDQEGLWVEYEKKEIFEHEFYYSMVKIESANIWCFAPHYEDALSIVKTRKSEEMYIPHLSVDIALDRASTVYSV